MTIQLRRRNNGGQFVIVDSTGTGPRTVNGARKALWAARAMAIAAVKLEGKSYLLDRPTWDAALANKRVDLVPYAGRFVRLQAAWLRLKERWASWRK